MLHSTLSPALLQAYGETEYRVTGAPAFTLRIAEASAELAAAQRLRQVNCSAFITACNPRSVELTPDENAVRQQALAVELRSRGLAFLDGIGQHPDNGWPGEPSFLVLGLALEAAKALGRRFEQNAIVWSGADAVPQLILLR